VRVDDPCNKLASSAKAVTVGPDKSCCRRERKLLISQLEDWDNSIEVDLGVFGEGVKVKLCSLK
jgi:hypothetical protein